MGAEMGVFAGISKMKINSIKFMIPFFLSGLSWRLGGDFWWLGPLSSLILPFGIPTMNSRIERFLAAFIYFAAGSCGLVPGSGVFFGTGVESYILGSILWLVSSAALAAPWAFASTGYMSVVALVIDVIPPLGLFGWLSPLAAAGVLFPGAGLFGIIFLLVGVSQTRGSLRIGIALIVAFTFLDQRTIHNSDQFAGVNTHLGKMPENPIGQIQRNYELIQTISNSDKKFVVMPETMANYLPGTIHQFQNYLPPGKSILIGVTTIGPRGKMSDSIAEISHNDSKIVFNAAFPVPVSMWHPWSSKPGYDASWSEPVRKIGGQRVGAVICYDQLLVWPWLQAAFNRPQIVLAISNDWWARGTGIPTIQRDTALAWSRLIGANLVSAENE